MRFLIASFALVCSGCLSLPGEQAKEARGETLRQYVGLLQEYWSGADPFCCVASVGKTPLTPWCTTLGPAGCAELRKKVAFINTTLEQCRLPEEAAAEARVETRSRMWCADFSCPEADTHDNMRCWPDSAGCTSSPTVEGCLRTKACYEVVFLPRVDVPQDVWSESVRESAQASRDKLCAQIAKIKWSRCRRTTNAEYDLTFKRNSAPTKDPNWRRWTVSPTVVASIQALHQRRLENCTPLCPTCTE